MNFPMTAIRKVILQTTNCHCVTDSSADYSTSHNRFFAQRSVRDFISFPQQIRVSEVLSCICLRESWSNGLVLPASWT